MTDRMTSTTRSLTEALLDLHVSAVDWQLAQAARNEKQLVAAFEATRTGYQSLATMQRDAARAWLDLVAPAAKPAAA